MQSPDGNFEGMLVAREVFSARHAPSVRHTVSAVQQFWPAAIAFLSRAGYAAWIHHVVVDQ